MNPVPGLTARIFAILARNSPGRALPTGPGGGPAGGVGALGCVGAACADTGVDDAGVGTEAGMAGLVIG
ncbi:hypothetical protein ACWC2T_43375 [Streptomyces sp. NPDC001393]